MTNASLILTDGHITVGNSSNVAVDVPMSGDVTIDDTGATTIKNNVTLGGSPTTTTQTQGDNSTKIATTAYVDTAVPTKVLKDWYADVGNTHTDGTIDPLYTYTVPANTLANNGDKLDVYFAGSTLECVSEDNYRYFSVSFGGQIVSVEAQQTYTESQIGPQPNLSFNIRMTIIRVNSNTVRVSHNIGWDGYNDVDGSPSGGQKYAVAFYFEFTDIDLTAAQDIVLQGATFGTDAAANDVVASTGTIMRIKAAN